MKRFSILALLVSMALASCSEKESGMGDPKAMGQVSITLGTDAEVKAERAAEESEQGYNVVCTKPELKDFALLIEGVKYDETWAPKEEGETNVYNYEKEYASVADFNGEYLYRGFYKATVTFGDINEEGYDKPAFVGVCEEFQIKPGKETEVDIKATIANALVIVEVTDNFKAYFVGGHTFNVVTANGNTFEDVTSAEKAAKPIFVAPTSFEVSGTATKQANQSGAAAPTVSMSQSFNNLAARTLYRVKMDVENAGQATLKITLNDVLVEERTIEEELNPWAPEE